MSVKRDIIEGNSIYSISKGEVSFFSLVSIIKEAINDCICTKGGPRV